MTVQEKSAPAARTAPPAPTYSTLLVHVEPGLAASRRVEIAAGLARAFDARLIGLGAEMIEPVTMVDPYSGQLIAEMYQQLSRQVAADLKNAEAAFRRDAAGADVEWRTVSSTPVNAIARTARAADLIVMTATEARGSDVYHAAPPADVVLAAGRPVLVAPAGAGHLQARKIVVAWKETREARRAVADAMPFLVRAEEVVVQAVCAEDEVEAAEACALDVAAWLRRHGAPARANVTTAPDASVADELNAEAEAIGADLIVAGAYGHSRTVEWALGGATWRLLQNPQRYLLLSH